MRGRGSEGRRRWKRLLFGNFVVQIYVYWQRGEERTVACFISRSIIGLKNSAVSQAYKRRKGRGMHTFVLA